LSRKSAAVLEYFILHKAWLLLMKKILYDGRLSAGMRGKKPTMPVTQYDIVIPQFSWQDLPRANFISSAVVGF
jgi:hypothetical protein